MRRFPRDNGGVVLLFKDCISDFVQVGKPLKPHGKWGRDGSGPRKAEDQQRSTQMLAVGEGMISEGMLCAVKEDGWVGRKLCVAKERL